MPRTSKSDGWREGPNGGIYKIERTAAGEERKVYKAKTKVEKAGGIRGRRAAALAASALLGYPPYYPGPFYGGPPYGYAYGYRRHYRGRSRSRSRSPHRVYRR